MGWFINNVLYRTVVLGKENIPQAGPVVFAANHISFLDGPVLFAAASRPMHVLIKQEMFKGALGSFLHGIGQLPVNRSGDRKALQRAKSILDQGRSIGILPEGTRGDGAAASVSGGVAWLALNSDAIVVPVAILGTRHSGEGVNHVPRFGRRVVASFGEGLRVQRQPGESGRASMDRAAESIRAALANHVSTTAMRTGVPLPEVPLRELQNNILNSTTSRSAADHH
ncbi:lysophospholipid acyltransferase family protein [Pseudarthrobacter sp. J1763]|uniref:lysophospholipid acyltransferase family protein n=1 Tax=Pseudarthrobacter sp. J1763 TaxID=3420445 RepID=UPI003D266C0F